jgi:hypothetical protein
MRVGVSQPDFDTINRGFEEDIGSSLKAAMAEAGALLKDDLRDEVVAAGLGPKLANTWRARTYPGVGPSLDPAAWVWSKAPQLIDVFQRGATIKSQHGFWLAIPTPAAGGVTGYRTADGKRTRITPGAWERAHGMRLRFIYRPGRKTSFLVADNARLNSRGAARPNEGSRRGGGRFTRLEGRTTVIVFILVRQVRINKRLNSDAIVDRAAARVPGLIAKHWK